MEEFVTSMIGFNLLHISKVLRLLQLLPDNYNLVKRIYSSFRNLHYEMPTLEDPLGVMYSLHASRVHELRGKQHVISITDENTIAIVRLAASIAAPYTVLDVLRNNYIHTMESRKKGQRIFKNLKHFITCSLTERESIDKINAQKLSFLETSADFNLAEWERDVEFLTAGEINKVDYLNVYSQALIHSNLFDSFVHKHHQMKKNDHKFPILTIKQMVDKGYKNPFVCFYDEVTGKIIINNNMRLLLK